MPLPHLLSRHTVAAPALWLALSLALAASPGAAAPGAPGPSAPPAATDTIEDTPASAAADLRRITLTRRDLPRDAPRFEDHPAERWQGRRAVPDVDSHPRSREFRTRLREGARRGQVFAGHYTLVSWGCGTACLEMAIVDLKTGAVHHPPALLGIDRNYLGDVPTDNADVPWRTRPDSRLIVVYGGLNFEAGHRGIHWFVWEDDRLRRLRFVPKPY
ncbi:hypothetical protein [Ideonella livida]|uniref:Secreted protein n=1 Tax=Ideonella livida TaxID=2707176 RepID=A0A7C9TIQ2_9BURK|nr:hypothetical protein [Ideonella livida]NDY91238.1 hypothetical protein [Ideonella livida]